MKLKFTILASLLVIVGFVPWMVQGQSGGGGGGGGGVQVGSGATSSETLPGSSGGGSSGSGSIVGDGGGIGGGMSGPQRQTGGGGMGGMGGGMGGMGGGMGGMGGGMGGMGGGMMGGMGGMGYGGMGGMSHFELQQWQKPVGREPAWLANGRKSIKLQEELRDRLNAEIEVDFVKLAIVELVDYMREKLEIQVEVNLPDIQELGLEEGSEIAPTRKFSGPVRDFLRRTLEPFNLTYRVHENYVEITSTEYADNNPIIRYYDLSYVLDNNSLLTSLISTIESSISPESWVNSGGNSSMVTIGNLLVIGTTETNHLEIERMLAQLARRSEPSNDSASVEKKLPPATVADPSDPFGNDDPAGSTETIRK